MVSRTTIARLRVREDGMTSVEYALMVAVIVVLLAGAVFTLTDAVGTRFARDETCAESAYTGSGC